MPVEVGVGYPEGFTGPGNLPVMGEYRTEAESFTRIQSFGNASPEATFDRV